MGPNFGSTEIHIQPTKNKNSYKKEEQIYGVDVDFVIHLLEN